MKQLNVAIIGQGRSGRDIHGSFLRSELNGGRFKIAAIAEKLPERRERAVSEYGPECFVTDDFHNFIGRDIDLVINSTTSEQHYPVTAELLNLGFNVVCEKPAGAHASDVDELIKLSEKTGKMYNIFQQSRFTPYFNNVKRVIASGVLGRIVEIDIRFDGFSRRWDWQTLQDFNAGSLSNTGPHPLDQALNLLDMYDSMPSVFCRMDRVNTFGDAEDYVKLILTAPDKPLIDLSISSCDAYPNYTYKLQGTRGGLRGSMTEMDWKYFIEAEAPEQHLIRTPLSKPDGTPAYCSENLTWHEEHWSASDSGAFSNAVDTYYTMIYDYLNDGKPMAIMPYQVRQQIAVIEEAHRQNPMSRLGE